MDGFVPRNGENGLGEAAGQPRTDAMSPSSTARFSGRKLRMLLCCAGAPFLIMLDTNIVAVSLPSIARDLRGGFTDVEWVVSAYILPFAALLMPAGALADRLGRSDSNRPPRHGARQRSSRLRCCTLRCRGRRSFCKPGELAAHP